MLKHIKHLLQANFIWFAVAVTIGIGYLSLIKTNNFPKMPFSFTDKIYHAIAYFMLTISWLISIKETKYKYKIVFACIIYGIIIEVLQSKLTMYRTGDVLDSLANTFGAVLALVVFNQKFEKKQFN